MTDEIEKVKYVVESFYSGELRIRCRENSDITIIEVAKELLNLANILIKEEEKIASPSTDTLYNNFYWQNEWEFKEWEIVEAYIDWRWLRRKYIRYDTPLHYLYNEYADPWKEYDQSTNVRHKSTNLK